MFTNLINKIHKNGMPYDAYLVHDMLHHSLKCVPLPHADYMYLALKWTFTYRSVLLYSLYKPLMTYSTLGKE